MREQEIYLAKSLESLQGAESELTQKRFNNSANRSYYACFQGAVAALQDEGIKPEGAGGEWRHAFVQAAFAGELIQRRKRYSADLRSILPKNEDLRHRADYTIEMVSEKAAKRALDRARAFIESVRDRVEKEGTGL
jgi:uncharacterized protein (UPF0332 family)